MKIQKSSQHPIDNFLKQTMKDDLTPGVENRLYIQLRQFQEKTGKQERLQPNFYGLVKNFFNMSKLECKLRLQFIKSAALTFASVVFIILLATAGFVPITGSQNVLAESFSTLTTSLHVYKQISRVNVMQCSVAAAAGDGERLTYSIKWTPGQTRVNIIKPGNIIVKTLMVQNDRVTIIDKTNHTAGYGKGLEYIDDPQFQPILDYLSPANFRESLQEKWGAKSYRRAGDCDEGTFSVVNLGEKGDTEIIVDMCTFLPTRIIKYRPIPTQPGKKGEVLVSIDFTWEIPFVPRLIDEKITVE